MKYDIIKVSLFFGGAMVLSRIEYTVPTARLSCQKKEVAKMAITVKFPCFISNAFSSLGEVDNGQLARELDGIGPILFRHDALINERDCCLDEIENVNNELARNQQHARRLTKHKKLAGFEQADELRDVAYMIRFGKNRRCALKERVRIINRLIRASFDY